MTTSRNVYIASLVLIVFFSILGGLHARANESAFMHRYVGDETCEVCHSSQRIGQQFQKWAQSPHAKAFQDLLSPEARQIARKLGIQDPQHDLRCLSCHTTAPGAHLPEVVSTFRKKDGVQCESCHGPGEDYAHFSTMIDPVKSKAAGLVVHPDEKTCKTCHNPASPTYKGFDFKRSMASISHPIPNSFRKELHDAREGR